MLDNLFKIFSYSIAYLNTCYLRLFVRRMGKGSLVFSHARIITPSRIELGRKCVVLPNSRIEIVKNDSAFLSIGEQFHAGNNLFISCAGKTTIGNGVLFSDNVAVIDNSHIHDDPHVSTIDQGITVTGITIGNNVTIYRNATILEGVVIGDGAIVGANSLVKKDVPAFSIVGGSPAEIIGSRV